MNKGKWKIIKFWDTISVDIGTYKNGWNYEVGFWVDGEIYNEEYKQMLKNYNPYIWYSSPYSQTFNLETTAIITLTLWKIAYNIFFITGLL